jgi:hypothetical protein
VGEDRESLPARILHVVGSGSEKIAVLELNSSFPGATALQIRLRPLVADEPILSLAYPGNERRVATGRFMRYGADDDRFAGMALLEMHDGNDRLVLDHGSSGAPAVDCEGRVVAVVTQAITQTMSFLSRVVRTSTAWQTPNVVAVPVAALEELARPE